MAFRLEDERKSLEADLLSIIGRPSDLRKHKEEIMCIKSKMRTFLERVEPQFRFQEEIVRLVLVDSISKFPISDCVQRDMKLLSDCFYIFFTYCLHLLAHQSRTEFHTIVTYSGIWKTLIEKYVKDGERLLLAMGYEYSETYQYFEWNIQSYTVHRVEQLIFECLLASEECMVLVDIYNMVEPHNYTITQVCTCRQENNKPMQELAEYMFETIAAENATVSLNKSKLTITSFSELNRASAGHASQRELTPPMEEGQEVVGAEKRPYTDAHDAAAASVTFNLDSGNITEIAERDVNSNEKIIHDKKAWNHVGNEEPSNSRITSYDGNEHVSTNYPESDRSKQKSSKSSGGKEGKDRTTSSRKSRTLPATGEGVTTRSKASTGDFTAAANLQVKLPPTPVTVSSASNREHYPPQNTRKGVAESSHSSSGKGKSSSFITSCFNPSQRGNDDSNMPYQPLGQSSNHYSGRTVDVSHPYLASAGDCGSTEKLSYSDALKSGRDSKVVGGSSMGKSVADTDASLISRSKVNNLESMMADLSIHDSDRQQQAERLQSEHDAVMARGGEYTSKQQRHKANPDTTRMGERDVSAAAAASVDSRSVRTLLCDAGGSGKSQYDPGGGVRSHHDKGESGRSHHDKVESVRSHHDKGESGRSHHDKVESGRSHYDKVESVRSHYDTVGSGGDHKTYVSEWKTDVGKYNDPRINDDAQKYTGHMARAAGSKGKDVRHYSAGSREDVRNSRQPPHSLPSSSLPVQHMDDRYAGFTNELHQRLYIDQVCNNVPSVPTSHHHHHPHSNSFSGLARPHPHHTATASSTSTSQRCTAAAGVERIIPISYEGAGHTTPHSHATHNHTMASSRNIPEPSITSASHPSLLSSSICPPRAVIDDDLDDVTAYKTSMRLSTGHDDRSAIRNHPPHPQPHPQQHHSSYLDQGVTPAAAYAHGFRRSNMGHPIKICEHCKACNSIDAKRCSVCRSNRLLFEA